MSSDIENWGGHTIQSTIWKLKWNTKCPLCPCAETSPIFEILGIGVHIKMWNGPSVFRYDGRFVYVLFSFRPITDRDGHYTVQQLTARYSKENGPNWVHQQVGLFFQCNIAPSLAPAALVRVNKMIRDCLMQVLLRGYAIKNRPLY